MVVAIQSSSDGGSAGGDRESRILLLSLHPRFGASTLLNLVNAIITSAPATTAPDDAESPPPLQQLSEPLSEAETPEASSFHYVAPSAPTSIHTTADAASSSSSSSSPSPTATYSHVVPWRIRNRYYDASVHFRLVHSPLAANPARRQRPNRAAPSTSSRDAPADVFEALQSASSQAKPRDEDEATSSVRPVDALPPHVMEETRGVPAVVLVVDRDEPLAKHRQLLDRLDPSWDKDEADDAGAWPADGDNITSQTALSRRRAGPRRLSGHELSISLVAGLASPLQPLSSEPSTARAAGQGHGGRASEEELVELYARAGWEFVDVAAGAERAMEEELLSELLADNLDDDVAGEAQTMGTPDGATGGAHGASEWRGDEEEDHRAGAEEEVGVVRIREALETHLWPGLVRKDDRAARAEQRRRSGSPPSTHAGMCGAPTTTAARLTSFSDFRNGDGLEREDEEDEEEPKDDEDDDHVASGARGKNGRDRSGAAEVSTTLGDRAVRTNQSGRNALGDGTEDEAQLSSLLDTVLAQLNRTSLNGSNVGRGSGDGDEAMNGTDARLPPDMNGEPTERDEMLAKAFLRQIQSAEQRGLEGGGGGGGGFDASRAHEELERFLDEHDGGAGTGARAREQGVGAVAGERRGDARRLGCGDPTLAPETARRDVGFEDDFADFVGASSLRAAAPAGDADVQAASGESQAIWTDDWPGDELDLGAAGLSMATSGSASASRFSSTSDGADPDAEFSQLLASIRAQAERVRAIGDPELRRREAERVALALEGQLG